VNDILDNLINIRTFIQSNNQDFEDTLLIEAVNVKDKITHILTVGNIDLINNAHKLVVYIIDDRETEIINFARQEAIAWATHELTLTFKLEWVQAIRRTLWHFISKYNEMVYKLTDKEIFALERSINNGLDKFLHVFFINYATYKDKLIVAQRQLVDTLSVPIIPINDSMCILPLIGSVDYYRTNILEEKVLNEIGKLRIQTLIMDLSGILDAEPDVFERFSKITEGAKMMGCQTVITGIRGDVVRKVVNFGVEFNNDTKTFGTLQQALKIYLSN
jgi:rsbT co-antagonist protein RsbR